MSDDVVRSTVTVDIYTMPSLFAEIANVPHRYRAARLLALAAMGLTVEKMQHAGVSIGAHLPHELTKTLKSGIGLGDGGVGQSEFDLHPEPAEKVIEEMGMGDLLCPFDIP